MVKFLYSVFIIISISFNLNSQAHTSIIDLILKESEVVVQGKVLGLYCRPQTDVKTAVTTLCIIQMEIKVVIKGEPKLSILQTNEHIVNNSGDSKTMIDTISGLCFEDYRLYDEPILKVDDEIIVFLRENPEPYFKSNGFRPPENWIIYSLVDQFIGISSGNEHTANSILRYVRNN